MQKTETRNPEIRLTVTADTLAGMLDCGKSTAVKIGREAGARIQLGKRVLYSVPVIEKYLAGLVGGENGE